MAHFRMFGFLWSVSVRWTGLIVIFLPSREDIMARPVKGYQAQGMGSVAVCREGFPAGSGGSGYDHVMLLC